MSFRGLPSSLFVAILAIAPHAAGQGGNGGAEPEKAEAPELPGFVHVPAGLVRPGCDFADYAKRHGGNQELEEILLYEVWGTLQPFPLPAFHFGRHEITNAQWKLYLDRAQRVDHKVGANESLESLAKKYVKFRSEEYASEWKAIFALNAPVLVEAWKKTTVKARDAKGNVVKDKDGKEKEEPAWNPAWTMEDPPESIRKLELPEGVDLVVYRKRVPRHWYGWCRLSGLRRGGGREYCNARKPPDEAFAVPEGERFEQLRLRAKDFAAYPIRDIPPQDLLDFAEWAGCHLPSEYEFERAGRLDNLKDQFTFGKWQHAKQKKLFLWADNPRSRAGLAPVPVDDPGVQASDSALGARHMHGNVWELTRTFFDIHPKVVPAPPPVANLTNYALIAKGGSYGDGWQKVQLSVRTGVVGSALLSLRYLNRADTLGGRLVRHPQPGYDLVLHSLLRICYDPGRAMWNAHYPHEFALGRVAGVDSVHIVESKAPYLHVQKRATGIAFVPRYLTKMTDKEYKDIKRDWKRGGADPNRYFVLGVLRSDVPLRGGLRLTKQKEKELRESRELYDKRLREWKRLPKKKRQQIPAPEKPDDYEPDHYEELTEGKNVERNGLWRGGEIAPGEWYVVFWNGFYALANKALTMPPDAIFEIEQPINKKIDRDRRARQEDVAAATLRLEGNAIRLTFQVEEQPTDRKKRMEPPAVQDSPLWAVAEVMPRIWLGPRRPGYVWKFEATFPTAEGALDEWKERQ